MSRKLLFLAIAAVSGFFSWDRGDEWASCTESSEDECSDLGDLDVAV